jgi:hypothetical protein
MEERGRTMYFFQCKENGSVGSFGGRGKRSNRQRVRNWGDVCAFDFIFLKR